MPQLKAPTRFLLRGSALLIGLLTLWWFVFLDPMLSALQGVGDIAARLVFGGNSGEFMREDGSRNWTFRVPKRIIVPASRVTPAPQQINSIDFDVRADGCSSVSPSVCRYFGPWSLPRRAGAAICARFWQEPDSIALVELILLLTFAATSAHRAAAALLSMPMGDVRNLAPEFQRLSNSLGGALSRSDCGSFCRAPRAPRRRLRLDHAAGEILFQPQLVSCGWQFPQGRAAVIRARPARVQREARVLKAGSYRCDTLGSCNL